MKTTIEIDDRLLEQMKSRARQRGITLRRLLEEFARAGLARTGRRRPYMFKDFSFKGEGLVPGVRLEDREQMRRLLYPDY
jgi:hypothetical protein